MGLERKCVKDADTVRRKFKFFFGVAAWREFKSCVVVRIRS